MAKGGKKGGKGGKKAASADDGRASPPPPAGPKNMSRKEAEAYAKAQWDYAQQVANEALTKVEEAAVTARWRPGELQSEMLHELRERRARGLARAREVTAKKAAEAGSVSIPALLCTKHGSNEERWLMGYKIPPPTNAPGEEPARLESDPDDRTVREIVEAMEPQTIPTGALPTAAFPRSNRPVLLEERPYTPRGDQKQASLTPAATA
jgi:hypothetical protein